MDRTPGKRSVGLMGVSRKASINKKDEKSVPFCSRIGCSAKVYPTKGTKTGSTENNTKVGLGRSPISSNGKEIVGSSSRAPGGFGYLRKTKRDTINIQSGNTVSKEVVMTKAGNSSRGTISSSHQKSDLGTRDTVMSPSVSSSSGSGITVRGGLSGSGLRNLRCSSVSDVLPTNSSSAKKICVTKTKNSDRESSSYSDGNKTRASVLQARNQSSSHGNGITICDNKRNRIVPPNASRGNSVAPSSDKRSGYFSKLGKVRAVAPPAATSRQTPHPATPTNPSPSLSSSLSNSHSRPNSSTGRLHSRRPCSPSEVNPSRPLVNWDGLSRNNMNGIAEVLLAIERIEHDHEIAYEQLASLETNLRSSGLMRFYDQHIGMRLDIDNMSYEELLALGDKMGTVITGLSEEALSRSLKKSIFQETNETGVKSLNKDDDIKCSICQEEYVYGDEVGSMTCEHMYHVSCVEQWLRMKNWCAICKTSAEEEKLS
ncbi:unnamed protein product [Cochlearia groenlandica]